MGANRNNIDYHLHNMTGGPAAVATPQVIYRSEDGILDCYGTTVPSDAVTGYAKGCFFRDVTNGKLYCNIGTSASANFNEVTVVGD